MSSSGSPLASPRANSRSRSPMRPQTARLPPQSAYQSVSPSFASIAMVRDRLAAMGRLTPGPGEYEGSSKSTFEAAAKTKIAPVPVKPEKYFDSHPIPIKEGPGPGDYDTTISESPYKGASIRHRIDFLEEKRINRGLQKSPGVGAYDPYANMSLGRTGTASVITPRRELPGPQVPGPGSYNVAESESAVRKTSGASTFSKSLPAPIPLTPGPGDYDTAEALDKSLKKAPAPTFSISRPLPIKQTPGPGDYDASPLTLPRSQSTIISPRREYKIPDTPGPGAYDAEKKSIAPSWTMRVPRKEKPNTVPGPGAYDNVELDIVIDSAPSHSFTSRRDPKPSTVPGPGAYDNAEHAVKAGPKSFQMRARPKFKPLNNNPGVGSYEPTDAHLKRSRQARITSPTFDYSYYMPTPPTR
jgi:hypothetical protein